MAQDLTLEERVSELENQVQRLTGEVFHRPSKPGWVRKITGSMANDPDFAEILRHGQEIRHAEREE